MQIIEGDKAEFLRQMYISSFVMTESAYYGNNIATLHHDEDGPFYTGYLWDTLKRSERISFLNAKNHLEAYAEDIYILWDLHSKTRICIPEYWKYPKYSVLRMHIRDFEALLTTLPEDIYIFDDTLSWSVILTHEEVKSEKRLCFLCRA